MAEDWVCSYATNKMYKFLLDLNQLSVYKFTKSKFKLWAVFIAVNRGYINIQDLSEVTQRSIDSLYKKALLVGSIADDKLFQAYDLFARGLLTIEALYACISYVDLGSQYVLKSDKSVGYLACSKVYHVGINKRITARYDMQNLIVDYSSKYAVGSKLKDIRREDLWL